MTHSTTRLEAFCDGVFAIAITLLILEIKVPDRETITSSHALAYAIIENWHSWFAFLLSFGTILIAWTNHHVAMKLARSTSSLFNFTNGFFLLTIVILPYPTTLLAEYIDTDAAQTAVMFYCATIVLQNIAWTLLFQSMLTPRDLTKNHLAREIILKTRLRCIYAFFVYMGITALAYWLPIVALILMALLWVVWIVVSITLHEENLETA